MPKAELHVHLEGAIGAPTVLALAARKNADLPAEDVEGLERWLEFRDFSHFLEVYLTISALLRDPEDFQLITRAFMEEQARQNVRYTEAHFTISTHVANGANPGEVAEAMAETVAEGERDLGVTVRWIPDIVRNVDRSRADQTLEWALEHRERGVVALGLSGKEDHATAPFREHFEVAAAEGLHRTVHAGEQTSAAAVWDALEMCAAERIGHGIRSVDDPELLEALSRRGVPLEVNPTSNVRLGLAPSLAEHPVRRIHEAGLAWSLNSDDPAMFHTTLSDEFEQVSELLRLDKSDIARLAVAAVEHAFLEGARKEELLAEFEAWFESNGVPLAARSG